MMNLRARWTPTQAEFDAFARVSGDDNPIHVDPAFSARTRFGRTVAHGMLIYSKLWGLLRQARPGARQTGQQLMFPNPSFAGESIDLEIEQIAPDRFAVRAVRTARHRDVMAVSGPPGSGKSHTAVAIALDAVELGGVERGFANEPRALLIHAGGGQLRPGDPQPLARL